MNGPEKSRRKTPQRIHALDSLRGLAAFVVLLDHCWIIVPEPILKSLPAWIVFSPFQLLVNGSLAVIVFFILSGYVLTIPYLENKKQPYFPFAVKRVCRIYIPFAGAIFFAAFLYYYKPALMDGEGSNAFRIWWPVEPLSPGMIVQHLAMTGVYEQMKLNGAMWTLVHELRISIMFPALILLCRDLRRAIQATLLILGIAMTLEMLAEFKKIVDPDGFVRNMFVTLRYIPVFMLGILLAKFDEPIRVWLNRLPRKKFWALCLVMALILCMPPDIHNTSATRNILIYKYISLILFSAAGGFLIVMARHKPAFSRVLNLPPLQWLGKVSYSFYLVHMPIMFFVFRLLLGSAPPLLILFLDIALVLIASGIFYALVEQPSMRLGRYLTNARRMRLAEKIA